MTVHEMMSALRKAKIDFTMQSHREEAVMFKAAVPGHRWEVEVFADGHVESEIFTSTGDIHDEQCTMKMIADWSE